MNHKVKGKHVIITGASSGIGEQLAWQLAEQGGIPILLARNESKLEFLTKKINTQLKADCYWYACDLSNPEEIERVFHRIQQDFEAVDALINNAGFGVFEYVEQASMESFTSMFDVNVLGLIQCVKEILPKMVERREGHIINIASQAGKIATPKSSGYAATKHAVLGFTNSLRMEVKNKGVFVTAVNLGPVRTNFFQTADPSGQYQKAVEGYMLTSDKVAEKVIKQLFTNKRELNMPSWMELGAKMYQLMPHVMEKLLAKQFMKK